MPDSRFNTVVILDCIPEDELNTARRLKESLEDLACYYDEAKDLKTKYLRIDNLNSLEDAFNKIHHEVKNNGMLPWFHLEGHGLDDWSGFKFPNNSDCTWTVLKKLITPINVTSNLNVVLVLATCFGGSFATAIDTTDRAPILALVGPTQKAQIREIEIAFPKFYHELLKSRSFKYALSVLDERTTSGNYYRTSAMKFFYDAWAAYQLDHCSNRAIRKRVDKMHQDAKDKGVRPLPTKKEIRNMLKAGHRPLFEKFAEKFFLFDMFSVNKKRFKISYKKIMASIRNLS